MKTKLLTTLACIAVAAAATGCDDGSSSDRDARRARSGLLTRAESCDHLLAMLKADATAKMNDQIDEQIYWVESYDGGFGFAEDGGTATSGSGGGASVGAPENGAGGGSPEHSETNVQVEGVDEADMVKTDGNHLYVLQGQELTVVDAWPTSSLGVGSSTAIEGSPYEMFVTEDQAVVFSFVDGAELLPSESQGACPDYGYYGEGCGRWMPFTKITVLSMDGSAPQVTAEHYLEGSYRSARRIGDAVRVVLNDYGQRGPAVQTYPSYDPSLDYTDTGAMIDALERLRRRNQVVIASSTLADYLPHQLVRDGGTTEEVAPSCGDYYVPGSGSTRYGLTTIASLDLGDAKDVTTTRVLGEAHHIYQSADSLYIAGQSWDGFRVDAWESDVPVSVTSTYLHRFDLEQDPSTPTYVATATVPGRINDQFSIDQHEGALRVVTTEQLASKTEWTSQNDLFTFDLDLKPLAEVIGLAPGESVFSARFVGDRGYVVTFRQVDPLFVFDLSDPSAPQALAELKIPGFSTYMHPIEEGDYLLTIGRDGDDTGVVGAPALQIFDVREPTSPVLLHKHVLEDGWSEAGHDHRAFTFYGGMLAIPYTSWDADGYTSSVKLFDVDVEAGITPRGEVDHSGFFPVAEPDAMDPWCWSQQAIVRRGVFIEDYLYSVSNGGVIVSDLATMASVASLDFDPEVQSYCSYY